MARTFREFTPANARSRSSYKRAVLAAMGMYDLGTDVGEAMRHNAGRKTDGLFHTAPTYPAIPIYANVKVWEFVTAYDINSTSVWKQTATGSGTALTVQDQNGGVAKVINGDRKSVV